MAARDKTNATKRGEASERIIHALAGEFPRIHDRESLLESETLKRRLGRSAGESLSEMEKRAAAKTLGRLIGDGTVSESLWLRGDDGKVSLPATGLIAVSVNISSLRNAWGAWRENGSKGIEPTQEAVAQEIMAQSGLWIRENVRNGGLPLALTNVSIIHGSNAFDILITAIYREAESFLQYTREVVQRVSHVGGTHTMQIAQTFGSPNLAGA